MKQKLLFLFPFVLTVTLYFNALFCFAQEDALYTNEETGYKVIIADELELAETDALLDAMMPLTDYGNAAFVSARPARQPDVYAEEMYRSYFGTDSGTLFLIDMNHRYLWIFSDGDFYKTVTRGYANTITSNVYPYASRGDYTACAVAAYGQMLSLMEHRRIAQPMKLIDNALLALLAGLMLNFIYMVFVTRTKKPTAEEVADANAWQFRLISPKTYVVRESRTYRPRESSSGSSSSGGGGGGFSGGGGGGFSGGGSSGGGGGHRF